MAAEILERPVIELTDVQANDDICCWERPIPCDKPAKVTLVVFPCLHEWGFCWEHKRVQEAQIAGADYVMCGKCHTDATSWEWIG